MIGVEEIFVGVVVIGDPVNEDEVFVVVVAIDAGFFVLVVDIFGVNSDLVVIFVVVNVVAIAFDDVVGVFIVVDDVGCCVVVASELIVGGSPRANVQNE